WATTIPSAMRCATWSRCASTGSRPGCRTRARSARSALRLGPLLAAPGRVVGRARGGTLVEHVRIEAQRFLEGGDGVRRPSETRERVAEQDPRLGVLGPKPRGLAQLRLRFRGAVLHVEKCGPEADASRTVCGSPGHRAVIIFVLCRPP